MKKVVFLTLLVLLFTVSNCEKKEAVHHDHKIEKSSHSDNHDNDYSEHKHNESEHIHNEDCEHSEDHAENGIHEHEEIDEEHDHSENLVHFPAELAEKIDFEIKTLRPECFKRSIHTSGELQILPEEIHTINATANGIITFASSNFIQGAVVQKYQRLFTISGKMLTQNSLELEYQSAADNFSASRKNYKRAKVLVAESIISEREFLKTENQFRQDSLAFILLKKNYSSKGLKITSPIEGYVSEILVSNGEYVESGTPLVRIHNKEKALLKIDFPTTNYQSIRQISGGSFKVNNCQQTWSLNKLNSDLYSVSGEVKVGSPFLPVYYIIDNQSEFIPGSFAEIWLNLSNIDNCIVLPKTAIIEQQGTYYVFVEEEANEYYVKRRIYIQEQSGDFIRVKSGLKCGEKVVTKGAMDVKLASMSSGISEHHHH